MMNLFLSTAFLLAFAAYMSIGAEQWTASILLLALMGLLGLPLIVRVCVAESRRSHDE